MISFTFRSSTKLRPSALFARGWTCIIFLLGFAAARAEETCDGGTIQHEVPVECAIDFANDQDQWTFQAEANDLVTITMTDMDGTAFAPYWELFDANNNLLINAVEENLARQRDYKLTQSGVFRISCGDYRDDHVGNYRLHLWIFRLETPKPIQSGLPQTGVFAHAADCDLFKFQGATNDLLTITLTDTNSDSYQPYFDLMDKNGAILAAVVDEQQAQLRNYMLTETDDFFIRVRDYTDTNPGSYRLTMTRIIGPTPTPSPSPTLTPSPTPSPVPCIEGPIEHDQTINCQIDPAADTDYFTFYADAGEYVTIIGTRTQGNYSSAVKLRLLDASQTELAKAVANSSAQIRDYQISASGNHRITVEESGGDQLIDYALTLWIAKRPPFTELHSGDCVAKDSIEQLADIDAYAFYATAGDYVTLTANKSEGYYSSAVRIGLLGPSGALKTATASNTTASISDYLIDETGEYIVRIEEDGDDQTIKYNLCLQIVASGTPGPPTPTRTPTPTASPINTQNHTPTPSPTPTSSPTPSPTPTEPPPPPPDRDLLILVAGGGTGPDNSIQNETRQIANYVYAVAIARGYSAETILYLSSLDSREANPRVDGQASAAAIQSALEGWARGAARLYIVLLDHGGRKNMPSGWDWYFAADLASQDYLLASELDQRLDALQTKTDQNPDPVPSVILQVDACYSGGFLRQCSGAPEGRERIVISSTSDSRVASFGGGNGSLTFSHFFFSQALMGSRLNSCFEPAYSTIIGLHCPPKEPQSPWLDDNGDGVSTGYDGERAARHRFGTGSLYANTPPVLDSAAPNMEFSLPPQADIALWANDKMASAARAAAYLVYGRKEYPEALPISAYTRVDLAKDGAPGASGQRWTGSLPASALQNAGTYRLFYTASLDLAQSGESLALSSVDPLIRRISVGDPVLPPDVFEDPPYSDSSYLTVANDLQPGASQEHTLHAPGDEDWGTVPGDCADCEIRIYDYVIAPETSLVLDVFVDGPTSPPITPSAIKSSDVEAKATKYSAQSTTVYYRVRACAQSSPLGECEVPGSLQGEMSYKIVLDSREILPSAAREILTAILGRGTNGAQDANNDQVLDCSDLLLSLPPAR